jgi:hypothetical protein
VSADSATILLALAIIAAYSVVLVVSLAFCRVAARADEDLRRLADGRRRDSAG